MSHLVNTLTKKYKIKIESNSDILFLKNINEKIKNNDNTEYKLDILLFRIGLYYKGKNYKNMVKYLLLAIEKEHIDAMYELAKYYKCKK